MLPSLPLSLVTLSILVVNAIAAPMPLPGHKPGDVVMVAPEKTKGSVNNDDTTRTVPHPHIVLGKASNPGEVHVVPISHANNEGFKPFIPTTPGMMPLSGSANLSPVTANEDDLSKPWGQLKNKKVGKEDIEYLANGRQQVAANHQAAMTHKMAHDAHYEAHHSHTAVQVAHLDHSQLPHLKDGERQEHQAAAQKHSDQATFHGYKATEHANLAQQHSHQALNPVPGSKEALHKATGSVHEAHNSMMQAHTSIDHAVAAHTRLDAANAHDLAKTGHKEAKAAQHGRGNTKAAGLHDMQAQLHHGYAQQERQHALKHQPANGHEHPHAEHSVKAADASHAHAVSSYKKAAAVVAHVPKHK